MLEITVFALQTATGSLLSIVMILYRPFSLRFFLKHVLRRVARYLQFLLENPLMMVISALLLTQLTLWWLQQLCSHQMFNI